MTEAGFADVKNLNPIFENDTASGRITDRVFEGLVEVDPKTGEPIPWLAESWDISPDGLKYTYKLRKGVSWSDGRPFTAHDVKFTWEAILDPKTETVYKSTFDRIAGAKDKTSGKATETTGIRVVDDYTLEVTLTGPDCAFLLDAGTLEIAPKHILEGQDLNTAEFNSRPTVGTGPWTFKEWVKGSHVTVARNEAYWGGPDGAAKGGPHLDQYIYKVVPDQTAILNNLQTAAADFGQIQPKDRDQLQQIPHADLKKWTGLTYPYIGFNLRRPALQDKAVRKALAMGLDTQTFIDQILLGEGQPLASHMPPSSWAYNPQVPLV